MEDMPDDKPQGESQGTPQAAVTSPLLANIHLDPLDWLMAGLGFEMVRYADDMVVLCRTEEEAKAALEKLREWMAQPLLQEAPSFAEATAGQAGYFACQTPGKLNSRASATAQTADWRAGCGRSASPVRRGERGESPVPNSIAP